MQRRQLINWSLLIQRLALWGMLLALGLYALWPMLLMGQPRPIA